MWHGRSTVCLAAASRSLLSVDHFRGDGFAGGYDTLSPFLKTAEKYGLRERMGLLIGDLHRVLPQLDPRAFDLFFYDADHTGETTAFALDWAMQSVSTVAIHDYSPLPQYAGAVAAIDHYARESGRPLRVVDTLAILESLC